LNKSEYFYSVLYRFLGIIDFSQYFIPYWLGCDQSQNKESKL